MNQITRSSKPAAAAATSDAYGRAGGWILVDSRTVICVRDSAAAAAALTPDPLQRGIVSFYPTHLTPQRPFFFYLEALHSQADSQF